MDAFGVDLGETARCIYPSFLVLMIAIENYWGYE